MSDPIKDALRAAVDGYDAERIARHGGKIGRDSMSDRNKETIAPMIAAAMAAFLRALPDDVLIKRERIGYTRNDFAGMIERAARDE